MFCRRYLYSFNITKFESCENLPTRSVVREGQKGLKPPFKYYRNADILKRIFETPSELLIP